MSYIKGVMLYVFGVMSSVKSVTLFVFGVICSAKGVKVCELSVMLCYGRNV
jgi:hypothetical protein